MVWTTAMLHSQQGRPKVSGVEMGSSRCHEHEEEAREA